MSFNKGRKCLNWLGLLGDVIGLSNDQIKLGKHAKAQTNNAPL